MRSEGSPVRKKIKTLTPPKHAHDSVLSTPSSIQSVKREDEELAGLCRRIELYHSLPSPGKEPTLKNGSRDPVSHLPITVEQIVDKEKGTFIFNPSEVAGLDEEDDEFLEAKIDGLVQELGRARARVDTLENELVSFISLRYARMKVN